MIYYQISFLIVLISVVCFSVDVDPKKKEHRIEDDIYVCELHLRTIFGRTKSAKWRVERAITDLKIYGKHATVYNQHVNWYYESFHECVNLRSILLPSTFCIDKEPDCEEELEIFKEIPPDEESIYGSVSDDEASSSGSSNNGMITNVDTEIMVVLKNALYYHVTLDPTKRNMPSEEGASKYFHENGSYGYNYLNDFATNIQTVKGKLPNQTQFCTELYTKHKRQKTEYENVAETSLTLG